MKISPTPLVLKTIALVGALGCASGEESGQQPTSVAVAPAASRASSPAEAPAEPHQYTPAEIERLLPAAVQPLVANGEALLVCAYDSDEKFEKIRLAGAIPLSAFERKLPSLAKDQLLVFY